MQGRRNPSPRPNRSFQYADDDEIRKISFVITFAGLLHDARALALVDSLTPAGRRVLLFFVALNRALKVGYRGTRATQSALADAITRATNAGCSVSTLKRGIADLVKAGLIVATWWNLYNRRGELVRYRRASGDWETSKIRIYSLTPLALSLWSKRPGRDSLPSPTQLKKSDHCNRVSQPSVAQPLIQEPVAASDLSTSDHVELSPSDNKTTPLPVVSAVETPATVGHELSTRKKTALGAVREFKTGCSIPPPPRVPKGALPSYKNTRIQILANIYRFLKGFPTRQADCLFTVATEETRPGASRRALPPCLDWGRVFAVWGRLSRAQRWAMWRRDILPGLRSAAFANPPDVEAIEKNLAKIKRVAASLHLEGIRKQAAVDARTSTVEGSVLGMTREDLEISKREKTDRVADYLRELKQTADPTRKELLQLAIKSLLRSL